MSFFSRKPNPPVPARIHQVLTPKTGPVGPSTPIAQANKPSSGWVVSPMTSQGQQAPKDENQQTPSNTRFRSFAERYVVERCRDWKEGEIDERAWAAILEARSIYNKVKEVGRPLTNDT